MDINGYINFTSFQELDYLTGLFAQHLKELHEYCQNSIIEISKKIRIPFQSVARYEKGYTEPSISKALKISSYFFLTLEKFIFAGDVIEEFEIAIQKLCNFAPAQNIEICKKRFPKLDIDKIILETKYSLTPEISKQTIINVPQLNTEEQQIIKYYRDLNPAGKKLIKQTLDTLRFSSEQRNQNKKQS